MGVQRTRSTLSIPSPRLPRIHTLTEGNSRAPCDLRQSKHLPQNSAGCAGEERGQRTGRLCAEREAQAGVQHTTRGQEPACTAAQQRCRHANVPCMLPTYPASADCDPRPPAPDTHTQCPVEQGRVATSQTSQQRTPVRIAVNRGSI